MLRRTLREAPRWASLLPAAATHSDFQQIRTMKLFEIFSKEKRQERRQKLNEEMQRGYFDDFRDFRDNQGKVFHAPDRLAPATHAPPFPQTQALLADGTPTAFPPAAAAGAPAVSLACIAFRAGAQGMIEAWAAPFSQRFQGEPGVGLFEFSLVESVVMGLWPFRRMLMAEGGKSQARYAMPATYLYHFGGSEALRTALHMTNRLTGYVYLLDGGGRVRWRGSGSPSAQELQLLVKCAEELLETSRR